MATIPHGEAETDTKIYKCIYIYVYIYVSHTQATKYYTASNVLRKGTEVRRMQSIYQTQTMVSLTGNFSNKGIQLFMH